MPRPRDNAMPPPTAPPRERSCKAQEQPAQTPRSTHLKPGRHVQYHLSAAAPRRSRARRGRPVAKSPPANPVVVVKPAERALDTQRRHRATATSATLRRHQPGSPSHPQTAVWPPARAPSSSSATPPSRASRRDTKKCPPRADRKGRFGGGASPGPRSYSVPLDGCDLRWLGSSTALYVNFLLDRRPRAKFTHRSIDPVQGRTTCTMYLIHRLRRFEHSRVISIPYPRFLRH